MCVCVCLHLSAICSITLAQTVQNNRYRSRNEDRGDRCTPMQIAQIFALRALRITAAHLMDRIPGVWLEAMLQVLCAAGLEHLD